MILLFFLMYLFHKMFHCLSPSPNSAFQTRLSNAFMLALLFLYQMLATTAFTLLNCVPIGNQSVLFIDGSVECYSQWQYYVAAYAACSIVPFSFVLLLGPSLMQKRQLSLSVFFVACIFPLPFVVHCYFIKLIGRMTKVCQGSSSSPPKPEATCVIKVLQGPFREINAVVVGPICWAGVQMIRRLILVLLFTFINFTVVRLISMVFVTFLFLLQHVYVQPYKDPIVNPAATASFSALLTIGGINLIRAGFDSAEYVPQGPNAELVYYMRETENVLMFWLPLCIMCGIFIVIVIKLCMLIYYRLLCSACSWAMIIK
jgi:hypothetical protein